MLTDFVAVNAQRYAGLFWKGSCGSYRADGMYNQFSIVLPKL